MDDFSIFTKNKEIDEDLLSLYKIKYVGESTSGVSKFTVDSDELIVEARNFLNVMLEDFDLNVDSSNFIEHESKQDKIKSEDILKIKSVSDFISNVFSFVSEKNVTDIHFEPFEDNIRVRMRVAGVLIIYCYLRKEEYKLIANWIKVRSMMDTTEMRLPQDGAFMYENGAIKMDLRIASSPTIYGEKLVLRVLDWNKRFSIHNLGFNNDDLGNIKKQLQTNSGCTIIIGPTGSGKSTTIYSMIEEINNDRTNIVTIEDPVERRINGITQMQVNEKIGFGFSDGLRSILRSDPDTILIGEIRDSETAKIAINSALTGKKVFTTLHASDAKMAIYRLFNLGISGFEVSQAVSTIISQRLIRNLCPNCKREVGSEIVDGECIKLYEAVGCECCINGYIGRKAVFEIFNLDDAIKNILLTKDFHVELDGYFNSCNYERMSATTKELLKSGEIEINDYYCSKV